MQFLTTSELLAVLKVARDRSLRDWLLMVVQFNHALRPSEVCAIKMDDIKNGSLTVQRRKGSKLTCQPLRKHKGQTLLDEVRGLSEWVKVRPRDCGSALFCSAKGGPITAKHYNFLFKKYALLAGLPQSKAHPHAIRHTSATLMARQGMDIGWIQTHLGHTSITSTAIYTHLNSEEVSAKAHEAFMDAFKDPTT